MSHQHASREPGDQKCVVIPSASGIGVCLQSVVHGEDLHPAGFIIGHEVADAEFWCEGSLTIDDAHFPHKWTMTGSLEAGDLTLNPSVQCMTHPAFHAYVVDGRWTA